MKALSVGVAVAFGAAGLAGAVWWSTVHAQQIPRHEPVKKAQIEQWKKELSSPRSDRSNGC
jgi:Flp pilus assembly protein CpaB